MGFGTQVRLVSGVTFILIGLLFLSSGNSLYSQIHWGGIETAKEQLRFPEITNRIVFWASEKVPHGQNRVHFIHAMVTDLDRAHNSARVYLDIEFSPSWSSDETSNTLVVIVQIPHNVTLIQSFCARYLTERGLSKYERIHPSTNYSYTNDVSFIQSKVPTTIDSSVCDSFEFEFYLIWRGCILNKSFTRYAILVPFATGYNEFLGSNQEYAFSVLDSKRTSLSVSPRDDSSVSLVFPSPDEFSFESGRTWFIWNISSRVGYARWVNAGSVMIEFEDNPSIQKEKDALFRAGLYFGIGASLSVAAFFETLRVLTEIGDPRKKIKPWLYRLKKRVKGV